MIKVIVLDRNYNEMHTMYFKDAFQSEEFIDTVIASGYFVKVFVEGSMIAAMPA